MKLTITSAILLFFFSFGATAQQTIHDYHYIEVPNQFEFLKGKDQYQLNSLTVFLFNKYGFNAYLADDLPLYLQKLPCKGLKAEVIGSESFLTTITVVVITDCYGEVIFTSEEGKSKEKDYRKAYHEAVRKSFESIAELNINQLAIPEISDPDIETVGATTTQVKVTEVSDTVKVVDATATKGQVAVTTAVTASATNSKVTLPEEWFKSEYTFQDYRLIKTDDGYQVYFKGDLIGTAKQSNDDMGTFTVATSQFNGTGALGSEGFTIYRQIQGMDQVITMPFIAKQ